MRHFETLMSRHKYAALFCFMLLFTGLFLSIVVPPLQSPDELSHLQRAYLLTRGQMILDTAPGRSSGGEVDTGLIAYMTQYAVLPFKPDMKVTGVLSTNADKQRWSGLKGFSAIPGTGTYLPLIYIPQAVGLGVGELLGLSVDISYRMARFFALTVSLVILGLAFSLYPPNPLALAFILLPMHLFQMTAASIDGLSVALCFFAVSAFMRLMRQGVDNNLRCFIVLVMALAVLIGCRPYLLPLLILPIGVVIRTPSRALWTTALLQIAFVIGWLAVSSSLTVDLRVSRGASTLEVIKYYASSPFEALGAIVNTLRDPEILRFYAFSFLGVLGWLDTWLKTAEYWTLNIMLLLIGLVSLQRPRAMTVARVVLMVAALGSVGLMFMALLLTWSAFPVVKVDGVQGRYFLIPLIMISYALMNTFSGMSPARRYLISFLLGLLWLYSFMVTLAVLLGRYYMSSVAPHG